MVSDMQHTAIAITAIAPSNSHPIKSLYPYVVAWPDSEALIARMHALYCAEHAHANFFHYCILAHKSDSPREAVRALSEAGAFRTHIGRATLLGVIDEARNTPWCKAEVLDTLERYARYAFVIEGSEVTCGTWP